MEVTRSRGTQINDALVPLTDLTTSCTNILLISE
jgi:hypothetical protein